MTPEMLVSNATAAFLVLVPVVIGYQLLTGRISLDGLIAERDPNGRLVFSPARLQLLLVTIFGAVQYFFQFIHNPAAPRGIDTLTLAGLGGSQILYLVSKARAAYLPRRSAA